MKLNWVIIFENSLFSDVMIAGRYRSICFLSSYEQLKFDLDRIQINMLKSRKCLILLYFFEKRSEIVNRFFVNFYIIKTLGRLIKLMCKNYRFMCKISKQSFILNFAIYSL